MSSKSPPRPASHPSEVVEPPGGGGRFWGRNIEGLDNTHESFQNLCFMELPPSPILEAALYTLHKALIYARNCTIEHTPENAKQANDFMEAVHEIPDFLAHWSQHNLSELRMHLECYHHLHWAGGPNLVTIFDNKLAELSV